MAIFIAVTAVCDCPTDFSLATPTPENAIAATAAKIKYFILCSGRCDQAQSYQNGIGFGFNKT
jgi:hypothetical protein